MNRKNEKNEAWATVQMFAIVFIILNSLGFPGKYEQFFGSISSTLCEYGSFLMQIVLMLTADSKNVMEYRIIDFKKKYTCLYLIPIVFLVESMLVSKYPQEQIITCVRFLVTVLFAIWLAERYTSEELLRLIVYAQAVFVCAVLGFIVLAPNSAFVHEVSDHDFVGILLTKNNAAAELSIGILLQFSLFKIMRQNKKKISRGFILLLVLQMLMIFLCNATGALFCIALPMLYLWWMDRGEKEQVRLPLGVIYIVGSVGFLIAALSILPLFSSFFEAIGKDVTLTGRVPLWRQIVKVMSEHQTFTGYGYGMFWRDRSAIALIHSAFSRYSFMGSMTTGSHNVILELWLNVGLLGLGIFFIGLLVSMNHIRRLQNDAYIFCASYVLWFTMFGFTERAFSPYQYHTLFLFIVMAVACNKTLPLGKRARKYEKSDHV